MEHILHLTVLDPAVHTRIYYKYALTEAGLGYEVTVVGTNKTPIPSSSPVRCIALPPPKGGIIARLQRHLLLWKLLVQLKPDVVCTHAPDLLGLLVMYKWCFGFKKKKKIWYDVFEDYALNLAAHPLLSPFRRRAYAWAIRKWENIGVQFCDAILYAEDCYQGILQAPANKTHTLLNTFAFTPLQYPSPSSLSLPQSPYMLYTGTLEKAWGIETTLDLWEQINTFTPLHLVIAGFSYDTAYLQYLKTRICNSRWPDRCTFYGGESYIPYSDIIKLIQNCTFGTGFYHLIPSIKQKLPTKFFEYAVLGKPLIFSSDTYWEKWNETAHIGFTWQNGDDTARLWQNIQDFHAINKNNPDFLWESYAVVLKKLLET